MLDVMPNIVPNIMPEVIPDPVLLITCMAGLIAGSYTDIRTREVPDWINFSLIAGAFGVRLILSLYYWNYSYILSGIAGFAVFFGLSLLMFYTGQWGGGDSKMLMAIGVALGLEFRLDSLLFAFLINTVLFSAVYGLAWSAWLAGVNWNRFRSVSQSICAHRATLMIKRVVWLVAVTGLICVFAVKDDSLKISLSIIFLIILLTFYTWVFVKSVEDSCMLKRVGVHSLTEGDWIAEDIAVNGRVICGPGDLGITKEQIAKLKKIHESGEIGKVLVKVGIPFIPCFLAGLIMALVFGNIILYFV